MARLPGVDSDLNTWGNVLNEYLSVAHKASGALKILSSVQDFGAVGDGVSNDTTAIQAAVDAAEAAGGGIVFFPPGTYQVGGVNGIRVQQSKISLIGSGTDATIIRRITANDVASMILVQGASQISDVGIADLTVDGVNTLNQTGLNGIGVHFRNVTRFYVRNVTVTRTRNTAFLFAAGCTRGRGANLSVFDCGDVDNTHGNNVGDDIDGLGLSECTWSVFHNITVDKVRGNGCVFFNATEHNALNNLVVSRVTASGIGFDGANATGACRFNVINGFVLDNTDLADAGTAGVRFSSIAPGNADISQNTLIGGLIKGFKGSPGRGIDVEITNLGNGDYLFFNGVVMNGNLAEAVKLSNVRTSTVIGNATGNSLDAVLEAEGSTDNTFIWGGDHTCLYAANSVSQNPPPDFVGAWINPGVDETRYGGAVLSDTTTESNVSHVFPFNALVRRLHVNLVNAPGASQTVVVTVRKNGVDTGLTVTLVESATVAVDLINAVAFSPSDLFSIRATTSGGFSFPGAKVVVEIERG